MMVPDDYDDDELLVACSGTDPEALRALFRAGADPDAEIRGSRPLHIAKTPAMLQAILEAGADVNLPSPFTKRPALHSLLRRFYSGAAADVPEMLSLLLAAGADVNARECLSVDWTPLLLLAANASLPLAETTAAWDLLLRYGANPHARTTMHYEHSSTRDAVVGCKAGWTPLHMLAREPRLVVPLPAAASGGGGGAPPRVVVADVRPLLVATGCGWMACERDAHGRTPACVALESWQRNATTMPSLAIVLALGLRREAAWQRRRHALALVAARYHSAGAAPASAAVDAAPVEGGDDGVDAAAGTAADTAGGASS